MPLTTTTIDYWGSGLLSLTAKLLQAHDLPVPIHQLAPMYVTLAEDTQPEHVVELLGQLDFETCTVELPAEKLAEVPLPAFTYLDEAQPQVVLLEQFNHETCTYVHPINGRVTVATPAFISNWINVCVLAIPTDGTQQKLQYDQQAIEADKANYRNQLIYQDNFLTADEVAVLQGLADGKYTPTQNTIEGYFESEVAVISDNFDAVLKAIMEKALALLPFKAAYHPDKDGLTVVSYTEGMLCKPHYDVFYSKDEDADHPNKRIVWTVIMYLTDGYEGGETTFPHLGVEVKGNKGGVLCFPDIDANGGLAPYSLHEGKQLVSGNKKICTFWLRAHNMVA